MSVRCPLPVSAREPDSSTDTAVTFVASSEASSSVTNRCAARIGPTVCELDGPMPIEKHSVTLIGASDTERRGFPDADVVFAFDKALLLTWPLQPVDLVPLCLFA